MTNGIVVLTDLDDTACHTPGKFARYVGDVATLGQPIVFDEEGTPLSFRSAQQRTLFDWLFGTTMVVPITGRSTSAFRRVKLPFEDHAIVSFGGIILQPDGNPQPDWFAHISTQSRQATDALEHLRAAVIARRPSELVSPDIVQDWGLNLFLKVRQTNVEQAVIDTTAEIIRENLPEGWTVHLNEGQLCAYPGFLDKLHAARFYLEHLAGPYFLVIGCGDSMTDTGFMSVCDVMLAPTKSQIFKKLLSMAIE